MMRSVLGVIWTGVLLSVAVYGQDTVIRLWPGVAPGAENWTQKEQLLQMPQMGGEIVRNVVEPTLTVFAPEKGAANGTGNIVCPGGGFEFLSWTNEGTAVAEWLNKLGVTAFVLKYRVADTGPTEEDFRRELGALFQALESDFAAEAKKLAPASVIGAQDGHRAVEVVRKNAAKYGLDPKRIGMIGFSAGASVALHASTEYTAANRPDFSALVYGSAASAADVPKDAPPIFVLCAADDKIVPPVSSVTTYSAWKSGGHSAELHIYDKGGHGFGMAKRGLPVDHWVDVFREWLAGQGLLKG